MDVVKWLIFSIQTTIAYTFECFELPGVALYLYRLIEPFNYPPSLHRQGLLYIKSLDPKYCDVDRGKTLIQRAADNGWSAWIWPTQGNKPDKKFFRTIYSRLALVVEQVLDDRKGGTSPQQDDVSRKNWRKNTLDNQEHGTDEH